MLHVTYSLLTENISSTDIGEEREEPEEKYAIQGSGAAIINNDDLGRLELIEQEVKDLVAGMFSLQYKHRVDETSMFLF